MVGIISCFEIAASFPWLNGAWKEVNSKQESFVTTLSIVFTLDLKVLLREQSKLNSTWVLRSKILEEIGKNSGKILKLSKFPENNHDILYWCHEFEKTRSKVMKCLKDFKEIRKNPETGKISGK